MISVFVISVIFISIFTFILQIWGIICIFIFGAKIKTSDKILFLMPIFVPVKSIRKKIDGISNIHGLVIYLNIINCYKVAFLLNLLICIIFLLYK